MSTTTNPNQLQTVIAGKTPDQVGTAITMIEEDTGTVTASATVKLKYPALFVSSTRVVTSGTAGSVGAYLVADSAVTPAVPAAANTNPGVAKLGVDNQTLTFPNTVTRVITKYAPIVPFSLFTLPAP